MKPAEKYPFFRFTDLLIPLILIIVLLLLNSSRESGDISEIMLEIHAAAHTQILQLTSDTSLTVTGNLGEMEIRIEDGKARIAASPCPGQDCVQQGWLSEFGDMTVCVPSGVFMIIVQNDGNPSPDAISY